MDTKRAIIRLSIVVAILFIVSLAYAEPNLMANGYDYVLMNNESKTKLVSTLFKILQRDEAPEQGVVSLDGLYYIYSNEVKDSKNYDAAIQSVFNKSVMEVLAEILSQPPDTKYDETMMKKYGLKLMGAL